jgi:hypothetical protein
MLPTSVVLEINRLLHEGRLSIRQIAKQVGVSRDTVSALASGRRGLRGRDTEAKRALHTPNSLPARCPECGYRVFLPCLICITRKARCRERTTASHLEKAATHARGDC